MVTAVLTMIGFGAVSYPGDAQRPWLRDVAAADLTTGSLPAGFDPAGPGVVLRQPATDPSLPVAEPVQSATGGEELVDVQPGRPDASGVSVPGVKAASPAVSSSAGPAGPAATTGITADGSVIATPPGSVAASTVPPVSASPSPSISTGSPSTAAPTTAHSPTPTTGQASTTTSTSSTTSSTTTSTTSSTTSSTTTSTVPDTVQDTTTTTPPDCTISTELSPGDSGGDVICLTEALNAAGVPVTTTDTYDPQVTTAVRSFQASSHIAVDGWVGQQTATLLEIWADPAEGLAPAVRVPAGDAQQTDRISIPTLGLDRAIVTGCQPQIDAGNVVLATGCGYSDIGWPGEGTVWLAAHRTTHGSTFNGIPSLAAGDIVTVTHAGRSTSYQVVDARTVSRSNPPSDAIHNSHDLVLQTSWYDGTVWLVYGDVI